MLSDVLLTRTLDPVLAQAFGGDVHARGELYAAVSGHHGGPERSNDRREIGRRKTAIGAAAEEAAGNWTSLLLRAAARRVPRRSRPARGKATELGALRPNRRGGLGRLERAMVSPRIP